MKLNVGKAIRQLLCYAGCVILLGSLSLAATTKMTQIASGQKAKVEGSIVSRSGDVIQVREKKSNELVAVAITDKTRIERKKGKFPFPRHTDMDVTAMLPGLTINAEGVGNTNGQLDASRISFSPDEFAVEVAEDQRVAANKAAAREAQSTANQGLAAAGAAQYSADQAQASAETVDREASAAGAVAIMSAAAVSAVNQRVSDLDDYKK